jgi:hypothetical protein
MMVFDQLGLILISVELSLLHLEGHLIQLSFTACSLLVKLHLTFLQLCIKTLNF